MPFESKPAMSIPSGARLHRKRRVQMLCALTGNAFKRRAQTRREFGCMVVQVVCSLAKESWTIQELILYLLSGSRKWVGRQAETGPLFVNRA